MDNTRETVYLAGLLHDIGKFYQRADKNLLSFYNEGHLDKIKSFILPEQDGRFGYHHAWWTYKFFYDNERLINSIQEKGKSAFKVDVNENTEQDNLINLAIYHHKPNENSDLQRLVQLADWWSSGMERTPSNMENEEGENYGRFKYKKVKLKNLLSLINNGKDISEFPLKPLNITSDSFPLINSSTNYRDITNEEATEPYFKLWTEFSNQLEHLPTDSVKGFLESLLFLLKKYTWSIPASTNDLAHISLYEHLKTTAAIALSLYDYQQETQSDFPQIKKDNNCFPLLLSCWDISGIQKFIYNISGSKASVSLKGRSFYLQLLMDTVKQEVLNHPDIQGLTGQVIYSSGGKMFILLPNTEKCKKALNELHQELEKIIWDEHKEALYVNHGYIEFRCDASRKGGVLIKSRADTSDTIADLWEQVIETTAANKYRKYQGLFNSKIPFAPFGNWGKDYDVCAVTGTVGKVGKDLQNIPGGDAMVLKSVAQQMDLGAALKDVDYVITYLNQDVEGNTYLKNRLDAKKNMHLSIPGTGIHHYLFDQLELTNNQADFRNITSVDVSNVRRINNTNFEDITSLKGNRCTYGYQFYGGNQQATKGDKNRTFEELCVVNNKGDTTYLGVLRMDVDNLGKIFKEGLSPEHRSFAAYSTLSGQLDWFFSGYLNTIRNDPEFKDYVNIIYSGGDDVFAVGRWDKVILFSKKIRGEFKSYCGGRDDVSISAGISIVGEKFPIRLAAAEAGKLEDKSKEFKKINSDITSKNAISFFGQTIGWEKEFGEVEKIKAQFMRFCTQPNKPLSKAILHQLMQWKTLKDQYEENKGSLSFKWHTAYYLKRYLDRYKGDDDRDVRSFLKEIQTALMSGQLIFNKENYGLRSYDILAVAARWAEMELKELFN